MKFIQGFWNPHATHYRWTLPDMHRAIVPVTVVMQKELEIAEMDKMRFTYRTSVCKSKRKGRALAANIVHSLDGWVVREMVRRAHNQGFWMAPIHDCFYASPLYMNQVRQNYVDILVHLNQLPAMKSIISEIAGRHVPFNQLSSDLYKQIANAEYALS
jgi:DNA-directed RNA polymerase